MRSSGKNSFSDELILEIPKTDLHLHLDGSIRLETLIELSRENGISLPSYTVSGLKDLVFKSEYRDLVEYLQGFRFTCAVLQNLESLERCAYELAIDNQQDGAKYIEVRFAPQIHMDTRSRDMASVLSAVDKGLQKAQKEFNLRPEVHSGDEPPFRYGLIVCAIRNTSPRLSPYYEFLASEQSQIQATSLSSLAAMELVRGAKKVRDRLGLPIVALDLAGNENGYPAKNFSGAFALAGEHSINKTAHAGEAYGPESIYQAVHACGADRIGHGYYLFDGSNVSEKVQNPRDFIRDLRKTIMDEGITIEVCLSSNLQTNPSIQSLSGHTFQNMLDSGCLTTICTDNRLISNTNLVSEYGKALNTFISDVESMKKLILEGFRSSFFPGSDTEKSIFVGQCQDYLDEVIAIHLKKESTKL